MKILNVFPEDTMLPMIYIDDAIESIWKLMNSDKQNLTITSYNISAFSISPKLFRGAEKEP